MSDPLEKYRERVAGTNIDPRSLLSTDYFNHFNTVIMLLSMLPDCPDLLDEIDAWEYISYQDHFKASGLDFAPLAIELYDVVPPDLREKFDHKIEEIRTFVEVSRIGLRSLLEKGEKPRFDDMCVRVNRDMQRMVDDGGAIVHGSSGSLDQADINKMFD